MLVGLTATLIACTAPVLNEHYTPSSSTPTDNGGGGPDGPSSGPDETTDPTKPQGDGGTTPVVPTPVTKKVKDLTGTGTSSEQFGVGGTDLGIPIRQPDGKIAYVFGDTFENDGVGGPGWRSPVLLRSASGGLDKGITFTSAAGGNYAKQLLDYSHQSAQYSTWLPSDLIVVGSRMYLHYIVNKGLGAVQWTQIAYSDDNGENWTLSDARWEGDEDNSLRQLWTWEKGDDGYVYVISTKFITRDQPIIMYRVPQDKILDRTAYEPWGYKNGAWAWGNPATIILNGKFGEMCLRRVESKWVLSWFNAGEYNITVKVFDSPTSNLYTAKTFVPIKGGSWGAENDSTVAQLYGGYIHPDSTLHDLHLIVSQWKTGENIVNWPYRAMQFVTRVDQ
jgi:hypothetical protein